MEMRVERGIILNVDYGFDYYTEFEYPEVIMTIQLFTGHIIHLKFSDENIDKIFYYLFSENSNRYLNKLSHSHIFVKMNKYPKGWYPVAVAASIPKTEKSDLWIYRREFEI